MSVVFYQQVCCRSIKHTICVEFMPDCFHIILLYIFLFLFFFNFTITFDLPHQVAIDLQHGCFSVTTLHSTLYRRKKMLKNNALFNKVIETQ